MLMKAYLNNSSTTQMTSETKKLIKRQLNTYYNPSDLYDESEELMTKIYQAKSDISKAINCSPEEIFFTSCGSEGDSWIIKSICQTEYAKSLNAQVEYNKLKPKPKPSKKPILKNHIITSTIEHKAVLNSCKELESHGFVVTYIKPDSTGHINPLDVEEVITKNTIMVSIMTINNILGTLQPVEVIGEICKDHDIIFHTDAVQALGNIDVDVKFIGCDAATFSGHKIHGPKSGFVYISKDLQEQGKIGSLISGGGQEEGYRAGTQNVPYIVGIADAVSKFTDPEIIRKSQIKIGILSDYIISELESLVPDGRDFMIFTVPSYRDRLKNNIHICIKNFSSDIIVKTLGYRGVYVSSGSACNSGNMDPDYVLQEIDIPEEYIYGGIRITLNSFNNMKECKYFIKMFKEVLAEFNII